MNKQGLEGKECGEVGCNNDAVAFCENDDNMPICESCLSKIHFGCSVEVIKDHYQVICEIYSVVDKNQKKILKFNENNQKILTNQFPNMMQNLEENKIVMKKIKKDKNYNSDALAQNVKQQKDMKSIITQLEKQKIICYQTLDAVKERIRKELGIVEDIYEKIDNIEKNVSSIKNDNASQKKMLTEYTDFQGQPIQIKIYIHEDGNECIGIGQFKEGTNELHGVGIIVNRNGDIQEGYWKNGRLNGQGRNICSTEYYVGEFIHDLRHGEGVNCWMNGRKYVGEFRDNNFDGQGIYYYEDGSKYVGKFKGGMKSGYGTKYNKDGEIENQGQWRNNEYLQIPVHSGHTIRIKH